MPGEVQGGPYERGHGWTQWGTGAAGEPRRPGAPSRHSSPWPPVPDTRPSRACPGGPSSRSPSRRRASPAGREHGPARGPHRATNSWPPRTGSSAHRRPRSPRPGTRRPRDGEAERPCPHAVGLTCVITRVTRASRIGTWRSLVAHLTGGQGVAGSNPVVPTDEAVGRRAVLDASGTALRSSAFRHGTRRSGRRGSAASGRGTGRERGGASAGGQGASRVERRQVPAEHGPGERSGPTPTAPCGPPGPGATRNLRLRVSPFPRSCPARRPGGDPGSPRRPAARRPRGRGPAGGLGWSQGARCPVRGPATAPPRRWRGQHPREEAAGGARAAAPHAPLLRTRPDGDRREREPGAHGVVEDVTHPHGRRPRPLPRCRTVAQVPVRRDRAVTSTSPPSRRDPRRSTGGHGRGSGGPSRAGR